MKLTILGSSSKGNCYILENDTEALIIECGVNIKEVKQALNFNLQKVVGCLMTHEHGDHSKSAFDVMKSGIDLYSTKGTFDALNLDWNYAHRANPIMQNGQFKVGNFNIISFDVKHDAAEPCGFLINHLETGTVLFLTDTYYVPYTFKGLHNIIVEANYSKAIIDKRTSTGSMKSFLSDRIIASHMSLETCKELLQANDLSQVNNIVLIHLSDGNSDAIHFLNEVKNLTGKNVTIADAGVIIDFDKTPF
jgi:phosphoribosyl 1,2-cyclic phosphodiesterase